MHHENFFRFFGPELANYVEKCLGSQVVGESNSQILSGMAGSDDYFFFSSNQGEQ